LTGIPRKNFQLREFDCQRVPKRRVASHWARPDCGTTGRAGRDSGRREALRPYSTVLRGACPDGQRRACQPTVGRGVLTRGCCRCISGPSADRCGSPDSG
jgi:hypothetical protein